MLAHFAELLDQSTKAPLGRLRHGDGTIAGLSLREVLVGVDPGGRRVGLREVGATHLVPLLVLCRLPGRPLIRVGVRARDEEELSLW